MKIILIEDWSRKGIVFQAGRTIEVHRSIANEMILNNTAERLTEQEEEAFTAIEENIEFVTAKAFQFNAKKYKANESFVVNDINIKVLGKLISEGKIKELKYAS